MFYNSFIHSDHLYSTSSSPLVLRSAPHTARILCRSVTPKRHRQLRVKDLPKVPTRRLERDSNPRPFERKASNQQISRHAPQHINTTYKEIAVNINNLLVQSIGNVGLCIIHSNNMIITMRSKLK